MLFAGLGTEGNSVGFAPWCDVRSSAGADTPHPSQLTAGLKGSVGLSVLDNGNGLAGADSWKTLEFRLTGCVDVDGGIGVSRLGNGRTAGCGGFLMSGARGTAFSIQAHEWRDFLQG